MASQTLEEWLPAAKELNPNVPEESLTAYWEQKYGPPPSSLPSLQSWLPDARKANPTVADDDLKGYWQTKYGAHGAPEKDSTEGDATRGFKDTFKQLPQLGYGLVAGAGATAESVVGEGGLATGLKKFGVDKFQEKSKEIAAGSKPTDSFNYAYDQASQGNFGALVDWLQYSLGYVGGQTMQALATVPVGGAVGKAALQPVAANVAERLVAKEAARLATTDAAKTLGQEELKRLATANVAANIGKTVALGAQAVGMEGGEIFGDLATQSAEENRALTGEELAKAFGASIGAGALEFVGDKVGLDLVLGKSPVGKLAGSMPGTAGRVARAGVAGTAGAATEGATEFAQTLLEEVGKGKDPLSDASIREAIDAAAMGAVGGGAMGGTGGMLSRAQQAPLSLPQPAKDTLDVQATTDAIGLGNPQIGVDEAIAAATSILEAPVGSDRKKADDLSTRLATRMEVQDGRLPTAQEAAMLSDAIPQTRPDIPILPSAPAAPAPEGIQIVSPPSKPPVSLDDPRAAIAEERRRLLAMKESLPFKAKDLDKAPEIPAPVPDEPLKSSLDLAYTSTADINRLAQERGVEPGVIQAMVQQTTGKPDLNSLTPVERDRFNTALQNMPLVAPAGKPVRTKPAVVAPPPAQPAATEPVAPVEMTTRPRGELVPEQSTEMLLRAEKAKADLEIGTDEGPTLTEFIRSQGGLQDQGGELSHLGLDQNRKPFAKKLAQEGGLSLDQAAELAHESGYIPERDINLLLEKLADESRGHGSQSPGWYKDLVSGGNPLIRGDKKKTAKEKIEEALAKIIQDDGVDVGSAVEKVKAAILADQEFHGTEWGRDLQSVLEGDWPSWIPKPEGVEAPQAPEAPAAPSMQVQKEKAKLADMQAAGAPSDIASGAMSIPPAPSIDERAHEAATSPNNDLDEPTEGQKGAGNYQLGHDRIAGLNISIENPEGSTRSGKDANGKPWSVTMKSHYGYIRGTKAADSTDKKKQGIDVFVKPNTPRDYSGPVFVVDQKKGNGRFDEHKVMLGYDSLEEARARYKENYAKDWNGIQAIKAFSMEEFKAWLKGDTTQPAGDAQDRLREEQYRLAQKRKPQQQEIPVPPPTIGERPIIAPEAPLSETPLFSKGAQEPDQEQTTLLETKPPAKEEAPEPVKEEAKAPLSPIERLQMLVDKRSGFLSPQAKAGYDDLRSGIQALKNPRSPVDAMELLQRASERLFTSGLSAQADVVDEVMEALEKKDAPTPSPVQKEKDKLEAMKTPKAEPQNAPIAVPSPNFQDVRAAAVDAEKAFNQAKTLEEKRKYLDKVAQLKKDYLDAAKIGADDYKARERFFNDIISRMNRFDLPDAAPPAIDSKKSESHTEPKTSDEVDHVADKQPADALGATAESAPAGVSPETVQEPESGGNAERPRPKGGRSGGRGIQRPAGSRNPVQRSPGEDSGATVPAAGTSVTHPTVTEHGSDYLITPEDRLEEGGAKAKFKKNVAAIRLVKQLDAEGRQATPDEQSILVKYTGWGGLKNAFSEEDAAWEKEADELRELLTPEEYETARRSIQYAHYTDPKTIDSMWRALQHMGLVKGSVLEPGMGTGNFFGATPKGLVKKLTRSGVEMDYISGRIAQQLYQRANIQIIPFQEASLPDNHFDVAIGNVPFSETKIADEHDKELNSLGLSLHNYYFAKTLRKVRPGGLVAFITSTGTMDNKNIKARAYLGKQADLIAAYRLPSGTFKGIANTEVTTDIVILRKRYAGEAAGGESWLDLDEYKTPNGVFHINEYFVAHPEHILGELRYEGTMYRENSMSVASIGEPANDRLLRLIEDLPTDMLQPYTPPSTTQDGVLEKLDAPDKSKPGGYAVVDGKLYTNVRGKLLPYEPRTETAKARILGMVGIRDALNEVFRTQLDDEGDAQIAASQRKLSRLYDAFVKQHGLINSRANRLAYDQDPDYPVLQALEKDYDPKAGTAKKADIFTKRTIEHQKAITSADSPQSALSIALNESNSVDFARMTELTGLPESALQEALKGVIYQDPVTGDWETASAYLSGNVREKLKAAQQAAKKNPDFAGHVEALKAIQPKDLLPSQIDARLGAGWIPPADVADFVRSILKTSVGSARYSQGRGLWALEGFPSWSVEATETHGTRRVPAPALIEMGLNSQVPTVYDTTRDGKRFVNEQETVLAREKLTAIKDQFAKWVWRDDARADRLAAYYNEHFNNMVKTRFDGGHLTVPGKNPGITLRPHQLNAVYRALQRNNTLLAHEVGTGKTFTVAAIAMEARRLGIAKKPMIVVPNHLVEQWGKEFRSLFPSANVLLTTKRDFEKANRLQLMGKIATGDWDAVVVPFTSFTRLPISRETFTAFMREQIKILEGYIREEKAAAGKNGNRIVKDLEKAKERFENKIKARAAAKASDDAVNFEQTGVDMLMVDEADAFKNLYFPTRMTRVAGLPNTESQRSFDMYMKTRYLTKLNNGRGVVFATGTPISNSMAEVFTMQRYLQQATLEEHGLGHFDAWARQFGETVSAIEMTAAGKYQQKTRFANFINVPELSQMFLEVMDVVRADEANIERPPVKTGKPINIVATPGEALKKYVAALNKRVDELKNKRPDQDNMLKITGDGRHAALDVRLRVPDAPEDKGSKVNKAVKQAADVYHRTVLFKGTQLMFLDLSTPKAGKTEKETEKEKDVDPTDENAELEDTDTEEERLGRDGVYGMIRAKLINLKVKANEIAFVHDAKTDKQKAELFDKVNRGEIRILLGSTEKMGAGMNAQQRLVALHDIDAPWRPRDLEQRHGRIIRYGNLLYFFSNILKKKEAGGTLTPKEEELYKQFKMHASALRDFHVEIYQYATEAPSFDVYMWQTIEAKAKVIAQVMRGDPSVRTIQDLDATALSASEMKAIASGNPLVMEKIGVDADVRKYSMLEAAHLDGLHRMRSEMNFHNSRADKLTKDLARAKADVEHFKAQGDAEFSMKIGKKSYDDRAEAGEAAMKAMDAVKGGDWAENFATYRGFTLTGRALVFKGQDEDGNTIEKRDYSIRATREGGLTYEGDAKTAAGISRTLDMAFVKAEAKVKELPGDIVANERTAAKLAEELKKPFEYEERLAKLVARQREIDKALMPAKDDANAGPSADASASEDDDPDPDGDGGGPRYSRDLPSDDETDKIVDLNEAMERTQGVADAFQYSPDGDRSLLDAFDAAFGVSVVPIKMRNPAADGFLAMQYHGSIFVRTDAPHHGFVRMAGHELLHHIRHERPELYDWFEHHAKTYLRADSERRYSRRLAAAGADPDGIDVREEILADFAGDALADPSFLKALADNNPGKFRSFVNTIIGWLKSVATRLTNAGFGSSRYITDVNALRSYLGSVLNAYRSGDSGAILGPEPPKFARIATDLQRDLPELTTTPYVPATIRGSQGSLLETQGDLAYELPAMSKMDDVIRTLQDKNIDLARLVDAIKATGKTVADDLNPVLKEELYLGRVSKLNQDFLTDELRPLVDAMRLNKVSMAQLDEYLYARHAKEANAHLKEINPDREDNDALSGMTDEEADRILAAADPKLARLAARVDAMLEKTRAQLVAYGLESQETVDTWRDAYDFYVPLHRAGYEDGPPGTGQGRSVRGSHSKARTGSSLRATNILANIAMDREKAIVRGEKMRPVIALAALLQENPNSDIATLTKPAPIIYTDPDTGLLTQAAGDIGEYRVPMVKGVNKKTGLVEWRPDPTYKGRDNVVNFRLGGVDHAIVFNEHNDRAVQMARALKDLDVGQLNTILATVAPATRHLAAINTQYNPVFGVVNFIRDVQFAMLTLSTTPLASKRQEVLSATRKAIRGIYQDARAIRRGEHPSSAVAKLWERFQKVGGPTGYRDLFRGSNDRAAAIEHMLDPDWWTKTVGGKVLTLGGRLTGVETAILDKVARPAFEWLSDYNQAMENAVRLGVFQTAIDSGMSDEKAASLAKNITVNFNKKGQITTQLGSLYAFFNASVQGTARIAETLFEKGKFGVLSETGKTIIKGGVLIGAMQAFALSMAGFDDGEPPEWLKARSLIIPVPGTEKGYVSIPMPLGFNVLPSLGRLATEALIYGKPVERLYQFAGTVMDAFSPVGGASSVGQLLAPTATDPFVALSENRDWAGRQIYREDFNKLQPTPGMSRAKDTSTPWARGLAEAINWATGGTEYQPGHFSPSPDAIDYLIEQVTGGVGRELSKASQVASGLATGDEIPMHKVPLLGRLVGSASGTGATRNQFYDNLREINLHEAEVKGRRRNHEDAAGYVQEHPEARLVDYANQVEREVSALTRRRRDLARRGASAEQLRVLDMHISARMDRFNQRVKQMQDQ